MKNVAKEGRTVVFVSHNLAAVRSLCHRCGVLEGGRLIHYGNVHDGIAQYLQWRDASQNGTVTFRARAGAGPQMTSVTLLADGQPSSRVLMGADLAVHVTFESDHALRDPGVALVLFSEAGLALLTISNRFQPGVLYSSAVNRGTIFCELGRIPLVAGRYSLSAYLGDLYHDTHTAEHCMTFEIAEGTVRVPSDEASLWWPTKFDYR
jgi:lipopolysaccharide transport system ATP-binding protein